MSRPKIYLKKKKKISLVENRINEYFYVAETQEELEESVKSLVAQNNNLVELLEKAKIKVPQFVGPKFLSFIVTVHDAKSNDENEQNHNNSVVTTNQQTSQKNGEHETKDEIKKTTQIIEHLDNVSNECNSQNKPNALGQSQQQCQSQPKPLSNSLPDLKEVQSFGSVDLIPVTSASKLDLKVHEKPVNNFVEITPLPEAQIEKSPTKSDTSSNLLQSKLSSNVQGMQLSESHFIDRCVIVIKMIWLKFASSFTDSTSDKQSTNPSVFLSEIQSTTENNVRIHKQNGKLLEKSGLGKAKNKSKPVLDKITVNVQCDKKTPTKRRDITKFNLPSLALNVHTTNKPIVADVSTEQSKREDHTKNTNLNTVCVSTELQPKVSTNNALKVIDNNVVTSNPTTHSIRKVENIQVLSKDLDESLTTGKDLSDELFGNFPLDQTPSESNPNALSPTAAFLLSFPVVSTVSCSKPIETDNSYSESSNLLRLDEKPNQPKDHSLFESISSILNDLNDVSDSAKNIANVGNTNNAHFSYFPSDKHRSNGDQEKNNTMSDTNANRSKHIQKNLNINNLLNDDKAKENFLKQSSTVLKRPNETQSCSTNTMPTNAVERINYVPSKSFENVPVSTDNTSDFYVSLSTLGLPLKSTATLPSTSINPSVGPHFNFQISSLAQPRNLIDSRPLIADTPFTFSLTKCSDTTSTTNSTIKTISQQSADQFQTTQPRQNKSNQKKSSPTKHLVNDRFVMPTEPPVTSLNRCNSFNPFSFDNSPMLPSSSSMALGGLTTVSSVSSSIGTPFTFTLTPSFSTISNSTPLLSNHDPLFSSSFDMPIMRSTNIRTKTPTKKDKSLPAYCSEKDQLNSWKNPMKTFTTNSSATKSSKNLVNWMTSSVNKPTQDLQLDFIPQLSHYTASEEPPAWSPNRNAMDNTNLISSSALPMLQGDLALNNISNSTSICNPPVNANKMDAEHKKTSNIRNNNNSPQKYNSKLVNNRKPDQNLQPDRNGKCGKCDKNLNQSIKNQHHHHHHHHHHNHHHQSTSNRMNETNPITNNFHSVSQLLDQERQTANKYSCYNPPIESKMISKETNSSNATTKTKFYPKYDVDTTSNQLTDSKYPINACNSTIVNNEITTNECDRDLFGGYFFGQSKRLKLNYHHSSSELLANQNFSTSYDNSTANDMLTPYANYQSFDSDCNNVSAAASSCVNNLTNQTYSYQYTQPQSYVNHQTQQQTLNTCDPIDSANYFQAPVSLSSYKPPNLNDVSRTNSKVSTHQSFLHQTSKSTNAMAGQSGVGVGVGSGGGGISGVEPISSVKLFPCTTSTSTTTNISTQIPVGSLNRNSTTCPTKTIHYPSHNNINNLPLNQAWNDSFSWMPYTNPIEKPYNNSLFNSSDTLNSKSIATNNIGGNNNNTIPNFNLTTIFPDYNKS